MKNAPLLLLLAGAAGVAYYLASRRASGTGGSLLSGLALGGTAQNTSLSGSFNLGANSAYDFGPADRFNLSGQGQGSEGFFTRLFRLSVTP